MLNLKDWVLAQALSGGDSGSSGGGGGGTGGGGGETGGGDSAMLDALIDRSITEVRSDATTVGRHAFAYCVNLTTANFPLVTSIDMDAFVYCSKLTSVNFPVVTKIGNRVFEYCSKLTTANFPVVTSIDMNVFANCRALTNVNLPVVMSISNYAFQYCTALTNIDFPVITSIGNYAFNNCSNLTAVILRNNAVCKLSGSQALAQTPISSGTGYIYVPSALVDTYKTETNWSTYAAQFRALEDYTVDGTTMGELDPSKI